MIVPAIAAGLLAAGAQFQWTGPHTEQYSGPGYFCGGGYRIQLARGDRALVLPQGSGVQGVRLVLSGREVNVWSGVEKQPGHLVLRYGETEVRQAGDGASISYNISTDSDFGLRLTSGAFHGFERDRWFFNRAKFSAAAENSVQCLEAYGY